MATVNYLIKKGKNPATIYVRVRDGVNTDLTASTSKMIDPRHWGKKGIKSNSRFADKINLESDLNDLKSLILSRRNDKVTAQGGLNKDWLKKIILEWKGENIGEDSDLLIDRIILYRDSLRTRYKNGKSGVAKGTLRNYNTTVQRLNKYETVYKISLRLIDMDFSFHDKYIKFATDTLGLSLNSLILRTPL